MWDNRDARYYVYLKRREVLDELDPDRESTPEDIEWDKYEAAMDDEHDRQKDEPWQD